MEELLRTTDMVLISHVKTLLAEANVEVLELDGHMSVLEGSIGFLIPRRLMVPGDRLSQSVRLLKSWDLEDAISPGALKAV